MYSIYSKIINSFAQSRGLFAVSIKLIYRILNFSFLSVISGRNIKQFLVFSRRFDYFNCLLPIKDRLFRSQYAQPWANSSIQFNLFF